MHSPRQALFATVQKPANSPHDFHYHSLMNWALRPSCAQIKKASTYLMGRLFYGFDRRVNPD